MNKKYIQKIKEKYTGKYTLGLDIGTNSVGWAVIDENFNIPVFKGKKAFGTRLFDAGKTAEGTRIKRGMRRRIRRMKQRIAFLQEIFNNEIEALHPGFFRLIKELEEPQTSAEELSYKQTLTSLSLPKILQIIEKETGTELLHKYPTIYHLRHDLIHENEKMDIRLVYLALHHIVKKRGNFLHEGVRVDDLREVPILEVKEIIEYTYNAKNDAEMESLDLPEHNYAEFIKLLTDKELTKTDKKRMITTIDKRLKIFGELLLNSAPKIENIFQIEEGNKELKLKMTDEELLIKLEDVLTEEQLQNFNDLHSIYLQLIFKEIIGDNDYLSETKVNAYVKYKTDLGLLKKLTEDLPVYRKELLKSSEKALTLWRNTRKTDIRCLVDRYNTNTIKRDDFYKILKTALDKIATEHEEKKEEIATILLLIDKEQFMVKLNSTDNSAIPYQFNLLEAKKIMQNQAKYYPITLTKEMQSRIGKIIDFRIPYYVGPLSSYDNGTKKQFNWLERKINEPIRPWNFYETVDELASAEKFITRMINKCTYLYKEDVLPKQSLIIQLFEVLNELNKIKVDEKHITKEQRDILLKLFLTHSKVSVTLAQKALIKSQGVEAKITGMQQEKQFASSLSSWKQMFEIFNLPTTTVIDIYTNETKEMFVYKKMMEDFILWKTVFPEGKIFEQKVREAYPTINEDILKSAKKMKCTGWGSLSKKLLLELAPKNETNKQHNIMEILYFGDGNFLYNLQQVITENKFGYTQIIENHNKKTQKDSIKYEDIAELAGSPAIKRGIWETIKIVKEIESIFGEPKTIVFEMARSDEKSRRTKSREDRIRALLESIENDQVQNEIKQNKIDYNNMKMLLYILQEGRCMYTNENISLDHLELYDIDHILPRSLIKDNSEDNLVLVNANANKRKGNYQVPLDLLSSEQKRKMKSFWFTLKNKELISAKKYSRLMLENLSDTQIEGFINRQLVETRQISKHVVRLLQELYAEKNVIVTGIKAGINDDIKQSLGIVKIRSLNNKHHAVDAYMAALIYQFLVNIEKDNFIDGRLDWKNYIKKSKLETTADKYNWIRKELQKKGLITINGEQISKPESIYDYICKQIDDTRFIISRKTGNFGKPDTDKELWNQSIYPIVVNDKPIVDVGKQYLGKKSGVQNENAVLITYSNKKGKLISEIKSVPIYLKRKYGTNFELIVNKMLGNDIAEKSKVDIHYVFEKNQKYFLNEIPFRFVSEGERGRIIEVNLSQAEQKLYEQKTNNISKENREQQLMQNIKRQSAFLKIMLKQVSVKMSGYYGTGQTIKDSLEKYIEILETTTIDNYKHKMELINNTVIKEGKKIDGKLKVEKITDVITVFQKYCDNYILKLLRPTAERISDWGDIGRLPLKINVSKTDTLVAIEQSVTGLHEKKILLIKNGKVVKK